MRAAGLIGPRIRRFLLEHLIGERNLARNAQRSYRDALRLLLPYVARSARKPVDRLAVTDVPADRVRQSRRDVGERRGRAIATRNQRLAALHARARFIGLHAPELVEWCGRVRAVPFEKAPKALITYLEKPERDALLAAPDRGTAQGRRDHALLQFLYNAGARAGGAAQVRIGDLMPPQVPDRDLALVLTRGKGNKPRRCPLWAQAVQELIPLVRGRGPEGHVFLNRCGRPSTRFGIQTLVERRAARAQKDAPSLAAKRVSPHTIRHTTATHLLRSGVGISTIHAWLGHVSVTTTNVYAEVGLEMRAKALANCEVEGAKEARPRKDNKGLMESLRAL
jgi:site-specific recombinase XerD